MNRAAAGQAPLLCGASLGKDAHLEGVAIARWGVS